MKDLFPPVKNFFAGCSLVAAQKGRPRYGDGLE
jgi:hypothetical protein